VQSQACNHPQIALVKPNRSHAVGFEWPDKGSDYLGVKMTGLQIGCVRPLQKMGAAAKYLAKATAATVAVLAVLGMTAPSFAIDLQRSSGQMPIRQSTSAPSGASGLCSKYPWACAKTGHVIAIDAQAMQIADQINSFANRTVRPISDQSQYASAERWALPTARGGDCEDYALLKKQQLIKAGFAPEQLLVATVLDRSRNSHAVLVLRTGRQDLVLDNMASRIKPWRETGYSFMRLQDPRDPSRWVAVFAGGIFGATS
jgi:predicted transglutaminase-like cysteine proteinase